MYKDYLILGGAGLVGLQVCRHIATSLEPRRIVVASLLEAESRPACEALEREFGSGIAFVPAWGDLFVPAAMASRPRRELLADPKSRRELLAWLYGDFDAAFHATHLVRLIRLHRPEVIVDSVNTATGLSYQNVFDGAAKVLDWLDPSGAFAADGVADLEQFLLSQSVPQLVRHVRFLARATTEYGTRVYVKVGTTGTGGMGLNIPYTHSEDKPSQVLLAKTEAAFGHTGLLFLLARTPGAPIVKEVKPAAMIGYRGVRTIPVADKHGNNALFEPREQPVSGALALADGDPYAKVGDLVVTVVDTGENGLFTRGEFAAITALGQMEYVTPEEIARVVVLEIRGANTGQDVISALDGSVMDPSYKAGLVRQAAMSDLANAESGAAVPSVALGKLGPPELSKLLFEAQLLKEVAKSLPAIAERTGADLSAAIAKHLPSSAIRRLAPSIGIPILAPDGKTLLRGPRINVPELAGHSRTVSLDDRADVDRWAAKGWVDLRPANMDRWVGRARKMTASRSELRDIGSAAASIASYLPTELEIGEVVAWIFNNELGGHRMK
jgi:hypothetical protein